MNSSLLKYGFWLFAGSAIFLLGMVQGMRMEGEPLVEYIQKQSAQTIKVVQAKQDVILQTEVKYRDRIKTVYIKGESNEQAALIFVQKPDDAQCIINSGFVRLYNASWHGEQPEPATELDREPTAISLSRLAEVNAYNAKVCYAWKEKALGIQEAYEKMQSVERKQE